MKKKVFSLIIVIAIVALMLSGCGKGTDTSNSNGSTDQLIELIFPSVSVPGDSHTEAMYKFAEKVDELSNGTVKVKVYDSASLFSSENEFDALLNGDANIAYVSFPTIATQIPSFGMFASGYFFSSYDHMTSVLNGAIAKESIWPQIEEKLNIVPLASYYLGSREINTRAKQINSYADMDGLLLRMPNSEAWLFLGEALGANPTPLSFSELYTALQTGAVDGQDNPLPTIESAKFYEVTKYIAITNHVVDSIMPCINGDTWAKMSVNQKAAVRDAIEYARDYNDTTRIANEARLISFFEEQGLTVTYPDINEFREKVQAAYAANKELTASWDMDLYNKIQAMAK